MTWLKDQPCAVCVVSGPSIVHHAEGATFRHNRVLVGHWFLLPLCRLCDDVVTQGSRLQFRAKYGPQSALWASVALRYEHDTGEVVPSEIRTAILDWGK